MNFQLLLQHIRFFISSDYRQDSIFSKVAAMDEGALNAFNVLSTGQKHELFYTLLSAQPDPNDDNFERIVGKLLAVLGHDYFSEVAAIGSNPKGRMDLLKKFPSAIEAIYPIDDTFLSAIDHAINQAPLPQYMQDPTQKIDQTHSIHVIKKLIDFKIDVRNICSKIACTPVTSNAKKTFLLKTTLHFAMDVGFDQAVDLLIAAQAYKHLPPKAPSAVEYAIWLNRPDYVEALCKFDLPYINKTLDEPSLLGRWHETSLHLCEDNKAIMEVLSTYGITLPTTALDLASSTPLRFSPKSTPASPLSALSAVEYHADVDADIDTDTDNDEKKAIPSPRTPNNSEDGLDADPTQEESNTKERRISPMQ